MLLHKLKVVEFDEIDSTNNYLKNNFLKYSNLTAVKTKFQTEGRGQFERQWLSNKNENLLFSLLLRDINILNIKIIKQIVVESLQILLKTLNLNGIFKEPNDIYINGLKVLGILIETKVNKNNELFDYIVIGIGINVNQIEFDESLNATSLKLLNKLDYSADELFRSFLEIFMQNYNEKMSLLLK